MFPISLLLTEGILEQAGIALTLEFLSKPMGSFDGHSR